MADKSICPPINRLTDHFVRTTRIADVYFPYRWLRCPVDALRIGGASPRSGIKRGRPANQRRWPACRPFHGAGRCQTARSVIGGRTGWPGRATDIGCALPQLLKVAAQAFEVENNGRRISPEQIRIQADDSRAIHFLITYPGEMTSHLSVRSAQISRLSAGIVNTSPCGGARGTAGRTHA